MESSDSIISSPDVFLPQRNHWANFSLKFYDSLDESMDYNEKVGNIEEEETDNDL